MKTKQSFVRAFFQQKKGKEERKRLMKKINKKATLHSQARGIPLEWHMSRSSEYKASEPTTPHSYDRHTLHSSTGKCIGGFAGSQPASQPI